MIDIIFNSAACQRDIILGFQKGQSPFCRSKSLKLRDRNSRTHTKSKILCEWFYKIKNINWLWISLLIVLVDQWTKYLAHNHLVLFHRYHVISFFDLSLTYNTGSAFSFLSLASGWQRWFLSIFAIVACIFILIWLVKVPKNRYLLLTGLSLVFGGALGNLIDRIRLGYVIDFIDLYIKNWHWPIFNIADSAISIGIVFLIIALFQNQQRI